jgi:hypothetical protein
MTEDAWNLAALSGAAAVFIGAVIAYAGVKSLLRDRVNDGLISRETASAILEGHAEHLKDPENPEAQRRIEQHNFRTINQLLALWSQPTSCK